jgi:plastocyanin
MPPIRTFAVLLAVAVLTACGGGGGAYGSSSAPTDPYGSTGTTNSGTPSSPSTPASNEVQATGNNTFNPTSIAVAKGTTVTFTFQAEHNVNFDNVTGAPSNIGNTSSGSVQRVFATAGTFGFNCSLHSGMRGQVVVN